MAPAGECGLIPDCDEAQQTSGWDDLRRCAQRTAGFPDITDRLVKVDVGSCVGLSLPQVQGRVEQKSSGLPRFSGWGKCRW